MSKFLQIGLILVLSCAPMYASAQYQPALPEHVTTIINGERYEAFAQEAFLELLRRDVELQRCRDVLPAREEQVTRLEGAVADLRGVVALRDDSLRVVQEDRARLSAAYLEENRLRLEAENRPDIGSWFAWGLAATFGVATVALSIVLGVVLQ